MKKILLFLLLLSAILTMYFAYRQFTTGSCGLSEGFDADKSEKEGKVEKAVKAEPNALVSLMGNLKRINGYLMDPEMWSHRIGLIGMTPVEMARLELTKHKKS